MLNGDQVWANQGNVVDLPERLDDAGVIDAGDEDRQEIGKQSWLLLEVEGDSLVVAE
jgi:hypothetical protein